MVKHDESKDLSVSSQVALSPES